ncbi:restriction endonuclease [Halobacterium sp. KA-4]|uniref:restriction endonuclease n=1 Tax=Halobacterium sp. KA-4 TaxID=2896367 RepID=UPI001E34E840|nr:restriction endonuclease [Halobacterium sp. KA-4]MCD2201547.1 restriction endonuclease [Halobacterium sp. KA-4]
MPATDLEIALEKVDADTFEKLATDILSERGYDVSPTEGTGADGGRDADLRRNDETGVAHFTTRNDWQRKLREDAQKTVDRDLDRDFVVFVVNQSPEPPRVVDEATAQLQDEYGFPVTILTRGDLRTQLTTQSPHLADVHLGIDSSKPTTEPVEEMKELKADRLDLIQERSNALPNPLPSGPCAVLHLFPLGMFSTDYGVRPSELPAPPIFEGKRASFLGKAVGDGVVSVNDRFGRERPQYVYLSERGYIEAVTTLPFSHGSVGAFASPEPDTVDPEIDRYLMGVLPNSLATLADLGAEPPVYAFISLLDVEDYEFPSSLRGKGL